MGRKVNDNLMVLVDADIVAFQVSAATQKKLNFNSDFEDNPDEGEDIITTDVEGAWDSFQKSIASIQKACGAGAGVILTLTCPKGNWRKDVLPTYKGNRKKTERPLVLEEIRARAEAHYKTYIRDFMEADDVLGILQTNRNAMPHDTIIASIDKDLLTIPGRHYNFQKRTFATMTPASSNHFFLTQVLTGDVTDGYKGCPGVGPKKADKLLAPWTFMETIPGTRNMSQAIKVSDTLEAWNEGIVPAYEKRKLTEEDALVQARVARICHSSDYDFKNKKVKLWTP